MALSNSILDLHEKRGKITIGYNPHRFIELFGGEVVEIWNYEPDPRTFRGDYYYNARTNQLFRKIVSTGPDGAILAHWRNAS